MAQLRFGASTASFVIGERLAESADERDVALDVNQLAQVIRRTDEDEDESVAAIDQAIAELNVAIS